MSIFSERLKLCRKKLNKTQRDVGIDLGMTEGGYQKYEINKREPNMETLHKIADYFDVSVDYLMGRSNSPMRQP